MVIVSFKCPTCDIDVISPVQKTDDTDAFASGLPVLMHCFACETPILVAYCSNSCGILPEGQCRKFDAMCLRAAVACRRRAIEAQNPALYDFFRKVERNWRARVGAYDPSQETALVVAGETRFRFRSDRDKLRVEQG